MKIIAWSDLHSDAHDDFSYQLSSGMNSRLEDCLNVIDKVEHYQAKYNCEVSLFAGDLFHTPQVLATTVFQETFKRLENLTETSQFSIFLAGNHDMASITADGIPVSTVYALRQLPRTKVVVGKYRPIYYTEGNVVFHCLPYIKDPKQLDANIGLIAQAVTMYKNHKRRPVQILVTHIALAQAVNGPNEIMLKKAYDVNELRKLGADRILSGHHHHPQDDGNWSVIGQPLQMNMLDRGDKRGVLIYDTTTKKSKRIWFNGSKFFLYEISSERRWEKFILDQQKWKGGYVRIMLTKGVVSEHDVQHVLELQGAKMYKIIHVSNIKSEMRSAAVSEQAMKNVGDLSTAIPAYINHVKPKGLRAKRLVSIGQRLARSN